MLSLLGMKAPCFFHRMNSVCMISPLRLRSIAECLSLPTVPRTNKVSWLGRHSGSVSMKANPACRHQHAAINGKRSARDKRCPVARQKRDCARNLYRLANPSQRMCVPIAFKRRFRIGRKAGAPA